MNYKHGGVGTPTYSSWRAMKHRCSDPEKNKWYGHVKICRRWMDFSNFLADMGARPFGTSLDRIDGMRGYTPQNCRWVPRAEQSRNKRDNVNLTFGGVTQCLAAWSRNVGLDRRTLAKRLALGWPIKDVLTLPKNGRYSKQRSAMKRAAEAEKNA